ncbi:MAG TPA: PilZ domain-containing protein [Terriglobales bacterium]|nr:PilZ domain-containing protein [Terriglobales bacterium]
MTKKKFSIGTRVRARHDRAPARFKGRVGTIQGSEPYRGYQIAFEDQAGEVAYLHSYFLEELTPGPAEFSLPPATQQRTNQFENRRSPRLETDLLIAIEFQDQRLIGACFDYNQHGFGAIVDETELPLGEVVTVELPLIDRKPLRFQAKAVHQDPPRYGFEFVVTQESKRQMIVDFFAESAEIKS